MKERDIVFILADFDFSIQFPFSWQKESKFLFSQVRLPPEDTTAPPIFAEGMEVEVYSRSNDREACGWWCADIKVFNPIFQPRPFIYKDYQFLSEPNRNQCHVNKCLFVWCR